MEISYQLSAFSSQLCEERSQAETRRLLQNDAALLGEFSADSAEELLSIDLTRRDLVAGRLHHPSSLFVERPLPFHLVGESGDDGISKSARRSLLEKLSGRDASGRAYGNELLLRFGETHWRNLNTSRGRKTEDGRRKTKEGFLVSRLPSTAYRLPSLIIRRYMELDPSKISGWIDSLAREPHEIAEVFFEHRREVVFEWRDGQIEQTRVWLASGVSARSRRSHREDLIFVPRGDEAGAREAVRALQKELDRPSLPVRPSHVEEVSTPGPFEGERLRKRLSTLFARLAPRHRFRLTLAHTDRHVIPARGPACSFERRLFSLEGSFTAVSRRRDETRRFSFHGPEASSTVDELKAALGDAGQPRETMVPCPDGVMDVVLGKGSAAVLFHEILSHPLEAGMESPLSNLEGARLAAPELDVSDDPTRLDLFGGYVFDDEGTRARPVKLLDTGRLGHRLTDRAHAGSGPSNGHARRAEASDTPLARGSNILVAAGQSTREEMARRLSSGLWIEALDGGSVELASGSFRLSFPRAHRVRRGRLADECGPGTLSGDILSTLKSVEPALGRQVHPHRAFGWCARAGQIVPVQGEAPEVLIRGLAIRSAP